MWQSDLWPQENGDWFIIWPSLTASEMDALRRTLGIDSSEVVQVQQSSTEQSMVIVDRVGAPPVLEETSRPQEDNQEDGSQLQMRDR